MSASPKHIFLWRPERGVGIADLAIDDLRAVTSTLGPRVVHLTEFAPPRRSVVPFRRTPLAMIAVRSDPGEAARALAELGGSLAGYRVDETVPRARSAEPEITLLTLFCKRRELSHEAFMEQWYGVHTPLALEVHPLIGYTRNAVEQVLVPGSPAWDGIVCEDFRVRADVLRPHRFFGGVARAIPNMARVGLHASRFLDLSTIENYLVREHRLG